jgi:two-component system sensor histidine kinase MtrB
VRVVATTVVLGLVTVALAGLVLGQEISERLLDGRRTQALEEAARGAVDAQAMLDATVAADLTEVRTSALNVVGRLEGTGASGEVTVMLLSPPGNEESFGDVYRGGVVTPAQVPADLRAAVRASGTQHSRPVGLPAGEGEDPRPALAVGQVVELPISGTYELYFLFDLSREQATLEAVQRVLLLGAGALVLLVGAVAAVVARQVVEPVREAAAVAERLAAGHLEQRIPERGQDDLARLARSFNGMAASIQGQISRLEQLGALQQRFVSDVSHELRTPLTTIRMAGELLYESRESFTPELARSAELLTAQVDRFEELLADLLEISRYDAGAAVLDVEPVDLRALAAGVVQLAEPLAQRRGTALVLSSPGGRCEAEVDRRRVERVVRNLVVNAVEHSEGRPVRVTVAGDDDAVAVRVRDHGIGLSPAEAARVFDRFWRADPARGRATGGTGLGLAIALEDAHLHGGRLEVRGRPGQGAAFLLTLPRRAGEPVTSRPLALPPDPAPPQGPRG